MKFSSSVLLILFASIDKLTNGVCIDEPSWIGANSHDCSWWASAQGHQCAINGDNIAFGDASLGMTADEACCVCGERGLDEYESGLADTSCIDSAVQVAPAISTSSTVDCAAECSNAADCDGFEMHTDTGFCYLKSGCGNAQFNTGSTLYHKLQVGAQGDPLITGLKGQVFKFDGRNGGWYANLAVADKFRWNMQFRRQDTCPEDEDMFISGLSFNIKDDASVKSQKILIGTTSVPECSEGEVCLGGGTLRISFDGGSTFIAKPGDYKTTSGSYYRVVAHNTYAACSRKWYDYDTNHSDDDNNNNNNNLRNGIHHRQLRVEKSPIQYLTENKGTMIDPEQCQLWMLNRKMNDDLFRQPGMWSTIHIETPLVNFHIEYRRSGDANPEQQQCNFESLDAWMTWVSPELLQTQEWNGILGETRNSNNKSNDRYQLLRSKDDADYEVDGPFGTNFMASLEKSSTMGNIISSMFS